MTIDFIKMQAQGNDYLFFDLRGKTFPLLNLEKLAKDISDRHFGVGSDGIVLILDDAENDAFMRIFNADGSEAPMCGSALRCTTWLLAQDFPDQPSFGISTLSGIKTGERLANDQIKVNLGSAQVLATEFFAQRTWNLVDIGNPHAISFEKDLPIDRAARMGAEIENRFDANIEFVQILSETEIDLQVWERGSGVTLACGTGAAAAVAAGIEAELLADKVQVNLPGGKVWVEKVQDQIFLSGEVTKVFAASWDL